MNSSARDSGSALCCISSRQKLGFTRPCRGRKRLTFRNNLRIFVLPAGFATDLYLAGDERRLRWCGCRLSCFGFHLPGQAGISELAAHLLNPFCRRWSFAKTREECASIIVDL